MLSLVDHFAMCLHRPRAGHFLVACSLIIGLVLAAAVAWFAITSRQATIDDALREMHNDSLMLAEQEDRSLQSVELVQLGLMRHMRDIRIDSVAKLQETMASREVQENLKERITGSAQITTLLLFDREGTLINFSRDWPPPAINGADRDFIREMSSVWAPRTYISEPTRGKNTGKWQIYVCRRFETEDGRLLGFIVATVQIDYFEQFFARLPLTGEGSFALFRRDGVLLARYPRVDPAIGQSFSKTFNFARVLETPDGGVLRQVSVFDGRERLIVPRAMQHFDLVIAISDTMDSVLRGWRENIRVLIATTALLELLIGGTVLLVSRHLRGHDRLQAAETARTRAEARLLLAEERERNTRKLHTQELRFDTAVNNMRQGLCMHDEIGEVVAANGRFSELFGLEAGAIGPGVSYQKMIEMVLSAGQVCPEDVTTLRHRRRELIDAHAPAIFAWDLAIGRTLMISHQPMESGWVTTYEDITEQRAAEARLAHLANHDALTGLPNRVLFHERLEQAVAFARRGTQLALLCLDLDQFKAVNDTLGHPVGDGLLRAVARRIQDCVQATDTVARLGGDEFAIVQNKIASPLEATALAEKLIDLIRQPFEIEGHQIIIEVSIGIAFAPQDGLDAEHLLKCADLALYRAQRDGRGVYRLFQAEMNAAMQARRILELDLRQAQPGGQLEVFYQPQVDVRTRQASGFEALLRWRHPVNGLVPPDRFIPLAEETGMIVPIGAWVLSEACAAAATWPGGLKVAVNLSAVQFKSPGLVETVIGALRESGLAANRLELEITETVMLQDTDTTLATLYRLRGLGIQIAMDDFGTGYSSLSYLRRFPFDRIKIDQSFVRELGTRDDCIAIVRAVATLGHDLGMEITAEGVETTQQLDALEAAGCTELQGYLFSRAVPASKVRELLRMMPLITELWTPVPPRDRAPAIAATERLEAMAG